MVGYEALAAEVQKLVDALFPPPKEPAGFLRYCWRKFGTGRTEPDPDPAPLDVWSDTELAEDLYRAGVDPHVSGWPDSWPEFNKRAKLFFRRRAIRHQARAKRCRDRERNRIETLLAWATAAQEALDET